MPYLTNITNKTKHFSHKSLLRKQIFNIKVLQQFWKCHPFEEILFHKRLWPVRYISSELWNERGSYFTVAERRKTAEEATFIALQAREHTKWKIELLEEAFEIEKTHLSNEEIEAQNRAELVELAISLEKKVDLSQIQTAEILKYVSHP